MRAFLPACALALGLSACEQPRVVTLADGSDYNCERVEQDQRTLDALRIIADSQINTSDPATVAELERNQADARQHVAEISGRVEACAEGAISRQAQADPLRDLLHAPAREWLQQREQTQTALVAMVSEGALSQADPDRRILPEERTAIVAGVSQCTSLAISRDSDWGERTVGDYMAECFTAAGIPMTSGAT